MHRLLLATSLAIVVSGAAARAHDMWIEPTTFSPAAGQIVGVKLRVGQDLLGDPIPRDPALIDTFVAEGGDGRMPIVGRDGMDPAGYVRVARPGLVIVGYQSKPSPVELQAEKFNTYLKEEGLDAVAAARLKRNETASPAHEIFSRCAKTLLLSASPSEADGDHALGFTLELVAERNPYTLATGQDLPVRLTYQGRPLEGALVVAINRLHPSERLSARSDAGGRVRFQLRQSGLWLIKAVHMIAAPAGSHAEWASYWASLTFQL
jgi:uncharacterized GH25 family protein